MYLIIPILFVYVLLLFVLSSHFASQFTLCFYALLSIVVQLGWPYILLLLSEKMHQMVYSTLLISDHYSHFLDKIMVNT